MTYRLLCTAAILALAACGPAKEKAENAPAGESHEESAGMKLKAGQWEMTSATLLAEIPGMPPEAANMMNGQKTTVRTCIKPEDVEKSNTIFTGRKDDECERQQWSMGGGKIHGSMTCKSNEGGMAGKMTMKLDGTYSEDNYDLTMDMNIPSPSGGMKMKTRVQGKRIGDCA